MPSSVVLIGVNGGTWRRILFSPCIRGRAHNYKISNRTFRANAVPPVPIVSSSKGKGLFCNTARIPTTFVRQNVQHRVILLPEVPNDDSTSNPLLKPFSDETDADSSQSNDPEHKHVTNLPDFSLITERNAYFGLGKALLEYESAVVQLEKKCEEGICDFRTLFEPFELARCQFESVLNSVNLLNLTSDIIDRDRVAILHSRAVRASASRNDSRPLHTTLKKMKADHVEGVKLLEPDQLRVVERWVK